MNEKILRQAKKDIPLYFEDFKKFWEKSESYYTDDDLLKNYATTLIFKNWLLALNHLGINILDSLFKEIHEDINASFFHAYFGQYRSAHMHLRSVIELGLQCLYFYQHEVEFLQWKNAEFRIKHEELTSYLKKHPNLSSFSQTNSLIDEITKAWQLFSKYIHGEAPNFFQTTLQSSKTGEISPADFGIWKSNFYKTGRLLNKLFLMFYRDNYSQFPTKSKEILLFNLREDDLIALNLS